MPNQEEGGQVTVKCTFYSKVAKRILGIVLSTAAILLLSPVYIIIMALELVFHGRPIFYSAKRPGKDGKLFTVRKFRSMTNETDEGGSLLPSEQRLTKFGKMLRRTSLDELPEIFSVFLGHMSVVGPRPLKEEYLDRYSERHQARHSVRPGLACVRIKRYPKEVVSSSWTWFEQFENDIWYLEHISFLTDAKMIFNIFKAACSGSSARTEDTRLEFFPETLHDGGLRLGINMIEAGDVE